MFIKNVTISETITVALGEVFATAHWLLLPFSRGNVHLGANGQINNPVIDPRYFLVDFDMTLEIEIGKQAQKFSHSPPMSDFVTGNVSVVPASKQEWVEFTESTCV